MPWLSRSIRSTAIDKRSVVEIFVNSIGNYTSPSLNSVCNLVRMQRFVVKHQNKSRFWMENKSRRQFRQAHSTQHGRMTARGGWRWEWMLSLTCRWPITARLRKMTKTACGCVHKGWYGNVLSTVRAAYWCESGVEKYVMLNKLSAALYNRLHVYVSLTKQRNRLLQSTRETL